MHLWNVAEDSCSRDNESLPLFLMVQFMGSPQPTRLIVPSLLNVPYLDRNWFILHQFPYVLLSQITRLVL